ncbi:MAG: Hsp20/alpha crystallin family protein [Pirellulales bacterium]
MVTRTDGLQPLGQLREEMDRLFSDFLGNWPTLPVPRFMTGRGFPAVNLWEEGDNLFAEAEVPGLRTEDLEISVVGNELTIKGERPEIEQEGVSYHRRERGVGPFTRVLRLPIDVDADRIEAALRNGVLLVTLPKAERAKPRKIEVKT